MTIRSVKDLLGDLTSNLRPQGEKKDVPAEERRKMQQEDGKPPAAAKSVNPFNKPDQHGPVYIPRIQKPTTEPVVVEEAELAEENSICPDNDGKEHQWSISRGKKSCWLCGAVVDPNKRSKATSWQATVYGTKTGVKK